MHKGSRHHLLVPNQYMEGGPPVKVFKGCVLEVGRKMVYSGVPTQTSLGDMSCLDGISPKRGKYGLRPLDACHRGRL